jgi:heparanase 1
MIPRRLAIGLAVLAGLGILAIAVPVSLWVATGRPAWLLLSPVLLLLLLLAVVELGLAGSHGNVPALVSGQLEPEPGRLARDISVRGAGGSAAYAVRVDLDLEIPLAEVPARYLSFAIDVSQLVGGRWWNPQADAVEWGSGTVHAPVFDFDRPGLDPLVRGLAPAYLRIGGSEADKVYYDLYDRMAAIPDGYQSVLRRDQWDAAHAFAARNGLDIVFTLNAGPAARDRAGRWQSQNAAQLLAYSAQQGYRVAAWELGNELNIFYAVHGPAAQVSVAQYAEDLDAARQLVDTVTPGAWLASQGSAFWPVLGEPLGRLFGYLPQSLARAEHLLDVITWHYYPQQSRRGPFASRRAHPSRLLDPAHLDEVAHWADKLAGWRDRLAPGKPLWLGETGNAQFGGEPGLSDTYLAGLWWLDQLGLMARHGQQAVVRQTLAGMDYGLLDGDSLQPRPDYWHSLLWKRLMGRQVYGVRISGEGAERLRVYAHAAAGGAGAALGQSGALVVLALNLDPLRDAILFVPELADRPFERYAVTAPDLLGQAVFLNGVELELATGGRLPEMPGVPEPARREAAIGLHPLSYVFLRFQPG